MKPLLQVENLSLSINGMPILKSISFDLSAGQTLGLVGESGSGKSMTALAIMRLLPPGAELRGRVSFDGEDLLARSEAEMCTVRGQQVSMAFQEPMTALNPLQTIGAQVAEVFIKHQRLDTESAFGRAAAVLERVGLPNKEFPLGRYPFELSGGQRQRVVIAIAVALKPKLLIADEPTTALDVTTEAKILSLLKQLCVEDQISLLFVSHDLAAVARLADKIAIMKAGEIVEAGDTVDVFDHMRHPYSLSLREASMLGSVRFDTDGREAAVESPGGPLPNQTVLQVDNVTRDYALPRERFFRRPPVFRAVDNVTFTLGSGESVGIVGESGSGKSTLVRAVLGLEPLQN
ncbi:MAG: ATP-binding cassette domain-containing protein, partial [Woeseiaceae bacterium]